MAKTGNVVLQGSLFLAGAGAWHSQRLLGSRADQFKAVPKEELCRSL